MVDPDLYAIREAVVLAHVAAENAHDIEAVLATFAHPRYEIVPTGAIHDGAEAVRAMLLAQWAQLPGLRYEAEGIFHNDSGLMVQTRTLGTAPDGRPVDMLTVNLFGFDGTGLVLERCWFDRLTIAEVLGYTASPAVQENG